jgi:hypothetical protein
MGGLDVTIIWDCHQAPLVRDSWIFKSQTNGLNSLDTNFLAWKCSTVWIKTNYATKWCKFHQHFK